MYNRRVTFKRNMEVGREDGTPVFDDVPVYTDWPVRSEQVNSQNEQEGEVGSKRRTTRKLMVKPTCRGQSIVPTTDMTVVVDGVVHDVRGVRPVEGASPKPVYWEVLAEERTA